MQYLQLTKRGGRSLIRAAEATKTDRLGAVALGIQHLPDPPQLNPPLLPDEDEVSAATSS